MLDDPVVFTVVHTLSSRAGHPAKLLLKSVSDSDISLELLEWFVFCPVDRFDIDALGTRRGGGGHFSEVSMFFERAPVVAPHRPKESEPRRLCSSDSLEVRDMVIKLSFDFDRQILFFWKPPEEEMLPKLETLPPFSASNVSLALSLFRSNESSRVLRGNRGIFPTERVRAGATLQDGRSMALDFTL